MCVRFGVHSVEYKVMGNNYKKVWKWDKSKKSYLDVTYGVQADMNS